MNEEYSAEAETIRIYVFISGCSILKKIDLGRYNVGQSKAYKNKIKNHTYIYLEDKLWLSASRK